MAHIKSKTNHLGFIFPLCFDVADFVDRYENIIFRSIQTPIQENWIHFLAYSIMLTAMKAYSNPYHPFEVSTCLFK